MEDGKDAIVDATAQIEALTMTMRTRWELAWCDELMAFGQAFGGAFSWIENCTITVSGCTAMEEEDADTDGAAVIEMEESVM